MSNSEEFKEQLKEIKNEKLRDLVEKQLNNIPEYFYHIAASSTSKYHNVQESGEGGLVRHVKAVFKIARDNLCLAANVLFSRRHFTITNDDLWFDS